MVPEMDLKDVKTPLVKRLNSISLYDEDGCKACDYVKQGFSFANDGKDLLI